MQRSPSKPSEKQNTNTETQKVIISEADQLSPVALQTKAANLLSLSPLKWSHYDTKPTSISAKNTGFTVMIQASFPEEVPYISYGPLSENYHFSQIHFHWGEHDETGSGHSVDGVRYPLEMHVVHVKKNCTNLCEATGTKDAIAIMVHLFSLSEDRNASLDQLTAILQFIQRPNSSAQLYPSSLAELVHPFSKDYFLYWGAIPGSGQQHFRIVWLVSRRLLPVSSQQLQQFRELKDGTGNFIWSNSNRPHPLGDRSLFIVSPHEHSDGSMLGLSNKPTRSVVILASDRSIEIQNAEYKSLCAVCPPQKESYGGKKSKEPSTHRVELVKVREGDRSVEESCVELGTLKDPEPIPKIVAYSTKDYPKKEQIKNVFIKNRGNNYTAKYVPSQDMYSVISVNEEEIHLRRRPLIVRKSEPSTEQACVFLNSPPSVHSARSAPSLTGYGRLSAKQECTDVSSQVGGRKSKEITVVDISPEFLADEKQGEVNYELRSPVLGTNDGEIVDIRNPDGKGVVTKLKTMGNQTYRHKIFDDGLKTEYLLVKQAEPKNSVYTVVGELVVKPDSKRTFVKRERNTSEILLPEIKQDEKNQSMKEGTHSSKNVVFRKVKLSFPSSAEEANEDQENIIKENINKIPSKNTNTDNYNNDASVMKLHSKVDLEEQILIRNQSQDPKEYYVTKITPINKSQQDSSEALSDRKKYYAQPIVLNTSETSRQDPPTSRENTVNIKVEKNFSNLDKTENVQKYPKQIPEAEMKQHKQNITSGQNIFQTTNSLEKHKQSDHMLTTKKVTVVTPNENADFTDNIYSPEYERSGKKDKDAVSSSHKNVISTLRDPNHPPDPDMSIKVLETQKSQTVYQMNNLNRNYVSGTDASPDKKQYQSKINTNPSDSSNKKTIKLAISIKNHGESLNPDELQKLENLALDNIESSVNKPKPLFTVSQVQHFIMGNPQGSDSNEIVIEEEKEEDTAYSKKSKKKITVKVAGPTYKIAAQSTPTKANPMSSHHLITINKTEVPDPYYLARAPRQPLVLYEAFPMETNQQVETIETEEMTSEVKTIRTRTIIKKDNKENEIGKSVTTEVSPNRSRTAEGEYYNFEQTGNIEDDIRRKITIDVYKTQKPFSDDSFHLEQDEQKNDARNSIPSSSSQVPGKDFTTKDTRSVNETTSTGGGYKSDTFKLSTPKNQSQNEFFKRLAPSDYDYKYNNQFPGGRAYSTRDQNTSTDMIGNVTLSKFRYIDVGTSNPAHTYESSAYRSQHTQMQQPRGLSYTDIEEEPTKDPGLDTSPREGSQTKNISPTKVQSIKEATVSFSTPQNMRSNKSVSNANDGKSVFYINQREPIKTEHHTQTSNLVIQNANETENKPGVRSEKTIQISKETNALKMTSTKDLHPFQKSEELMQSHDYDNSDKETDSHFNVTFKSDAKLQLPDGQTAQMKSIGEVKFKPPKKSGTGSSKTTRVESKQNQISVKTEDKSCSATDFTEGRYNLSRDSSMSSVTDGLLQDESADVNYSPVRIQTDEAVFKRFPPLQFIDHWNIPTNVDALLENNGKTVRATFLEDNELPILRGGPLDGDYVFAELHFHWGRKDCCGAEHIVDGVRFSMEAHFLYFKAEYETVKEALNHDDGLAMVAILLNVGGPPHPLLDRLIKEIPLIKEAETGVYVPAEAMFTWMQSAVDEAEGYFSYKGTMTSEPPYVEALTWLVFTKPVVFCCQQSLEFRKLMSQNGELLLKTFRTPRPLNNRTIFYAPL